MGTLKTADGLILLNNENTSDHYLQCRGMNKTLFSDPRVKKLCITIAVLETIRNHGYRAKYPPILTPGTCLRVL